MGVRYHAYLVRKDTFRVEPERSAVDFDEYPVVQLDHLISTFIAVRGSIDCREQRYKLPCAREVESISDNMLETLNIRRHPSPQTLSLFSQATKDFIHLREGLSRLSL
jgi:hypothetical protein